MIISKWQILIIYTIISQAFFFPGIPHTHLNKLVDPSGFFIGRAKKPLNDTYITYTHAHIHIHIHTHTYTHIHTHAHTHTKSEEIFTHKNQVLECGKHACIRVDGTFSKPTCGTIQCTQTEGLVKSLSAQTDQFSLIVINRANSHKAHAH